MLTVDASSGYCFSNTASVNKALIVGLKGRCFVRVSVKVGRVSSKEPKQKLNKLRSKKPTARRSIILKSASWYANAALSIGASVKANPSTY